MDYELVANIVSLDEDGEMLVLAFSANDGATEKYFMLQYPLQTGEQDRDLGLGGLYIERDDQLFGCHRGVASIRTNGSNVEVNLNDKGKRRLKVDRVVIAPTHWSPTIDQGLARLAELSSGEYVVETR